jgi:hypothetical protein
LTRKLTIHHSLGVLILLACLLGGSLSSCSRSADRKEDASNDPELVYKRRDDGTISSANQVDEMGIVHGIRVTYFRDGKTVSSKRSFNHGFKQGPSVKYYKNGQVFEHSSYENGERHGPHRKYYKSGELLAEYNYENGHALPGLKEYELDGTLLTSYPEVEFREIDHLASRSRIDLELSCTRTKGKMKYFVLEQEEGMTSRVYLITENGSATMQFYVKPGETLDMKVDILAEIPTDLGNILVLELSYQLSVKNVY